MFQGTYTAIITPFQGGNVDEKKLATLVALQVRAGVDGIVACGSTGEFLYLAPDERRTIIDICADGCKGKAKLVVGCAALSAKETIELTHQAQKAGADGALIINPWFVKLSQESIVQYYKEINDAVDLPILLYNNAARTGVDMSVDTIVRVASLKNIRCLKECATSLARVCEFRQRLGDDFTLLDGNDDTLAGFLGMGGDGGIFIASNVAPSLYVALMKSWRAGHLDAFKALWQQLYPLSAVLSLERIKYAMALVHGVSLETRLPFAPLTAATQQEIETVLHALELWAPLASVRTQ